MASRQEIIQRLDIAGLLRELLPDAKASGTNKLLARCPWPERHRNNDASPSFLTFLGDGDYKCQACGEKGSIFDLYGKVHGLNYKSAIMELTKRVGLEPTARHQRVTGHYAYLDSDGKCLYWKERIEPGKDGSAKDFIFFHGDGIEPGKAFCLPKEKRKVYLGRGGDPVLYRLQEVLASTKVIFTEGEKHADLLHEWGLTATTLDSGSQSKLTPVMVEQLTGKNIVILPDNDPPGREYATRIAAALIAKAASVKVVELPGLPEKGDLIDWVKKPGNVKNLLLELIDECGEWGHETQQRPKLIDDQPETEEIHFQMPPQKNRSFPRLYLDLELILNDPRRYNFQHGVSPLYDSFVLRIARSPGVRIPNIPRAVAHVLETDEGIVQHLLDTALQHGMLVLDGEGNLTHPMVSEQYAKALKKCQVNAENGAKGGEGNSVKNKRKKSAKRALGD
jgi:hypothetical protein